VKDVIKNWLSWVFDNFDNMLSNVVDVLGGAGLNVFGILSGPQAAIRAVAMSIAVICVLIELAQVAAKVDIIKWEMGLKVCLKLVLAKVAIDNGAVFLQACWNQGIIFMNSINPPSAALGRSIYEQSLEPLIEKANLIGQIGMLLPALLLTIIIGAVGMIIYVIALARLFEVSIYILVSPIPFAFFPLGNGDGSGFSRITAKFLKTFAAVCLHGVMIIACFVVWGALSGAMTRAVVVDNGNMFGAAMGVVLQSIVLCVAITKCGGWAKAILEV